MSDSIDRSIAIKMLIENKPMIWQNDDYELGMLNQYENDLAIIEAVPSAQPEIIRCEDCRHWKSNEFIGNNDVSTILLHTYPCKTGLTDAKWFCGYGRRKQDATS